MKNENYIENALNLKKFSDYLDFPLFFEIETVNACNAVCTMCTINKWQKHRNPYMSPQLFKKISDELIQYSTVVRTVNLGRDGEPLLDKHLEKKIGYLKEGGIKNVTFSTNAALLSEKRSKELLNSGLDEIMFSVDGYSRITFEKIRRGLCFKKIVENVHRFIDLRNSQNEHLKIRVRMVVQQENKDEIEPWGKYWRGKLKPKDSVEAKNIHSWGNQLENYQVLKQEEKLLTPCTSPFSTMIIRFNGDITICPLDFNGKYVNGNVQQDTIQTIWGKGGYFKKFRQIHLYSKRDELYFCKGCRLWEPDKTKRVF